MSSLGSDRWLLVGMAMAALFVTRRLLVAWRRWRRDPKRTADRNDRAEMFEQWGNRCAYRHLTLHRLVWCSRGPLQAAHQTAHANGGRTKPSNLQPQCRRHNREQSTMSNARYVMTRTTPILGWIVYVVRHARATARRRR